MQIKNLAFIKIKIELLHTALFSCTGSGILPFPAYIITALETDDEGNTWFFISRKWGQVVTVDVSFPARLEFYRKGLRHSLTVQGSASVVICGETRQRLLQTLTGTKTMEKEDALPELLLLKVKIETADYRELVAPRLWQPLYNMGRYVTDLFLARSQQLSSTA